MDVSSRRSLSHNNFQIQVSCAETTLMVGNHQWNTPKGGLRSAGVGEGVGGGAQPCCCFFFFFSTFTFVFHCLNNFGKTDSKASTFAHLHKPLSLSFFLFHVFDLNFGKTK